MALGGHVLVLLVIISLALTLTFVKQIHNESFSFHKLIPDLRRVHDASLSSILSITQSSSSSRSIPKPFDTNNYPIYQSLSKTLLAWNPDVTDIPSNFIEHIQSFDFSNQTERQWAAEYRDQEVPFKAYNIPEFTSLSAKWTDEYLANKLKSANAHVERANDNHFMYYRSGNSNNKHQQEQRYREEKQEEQAHQDKVDMSFKDWLKIAKDADRLKIGSSAKHYYYSISTSTMKPPHVKGNNNDKKKEIAAANLRARFGFVEEDILLFDPNKDNFFSWDPDSNKGIQCRFGMRGVIAEAHYDNGKNMVAMIRGRKRYILTPPKSCSKLNIHTDINHPSFRHSRIDWSSVEDIRRHQSNFDNVDAIDTIVNEGEVIYIPSYWFHYIVSLELNIQCNTRSGTAEGFGQEEIEKCIGSPTYGHNKDKDKYRGRRSRRRSGKGRGKGNDNDSGERGKKHGSKMRMKRENGNYDRKNDFQ
jgi:hypothetical protein